MSREILFRGKRKDNGEWVEGMPIIHGNYTAIMEWREDLNEFDEVEVFPETIGQFTELCDKNGTKIFEGDIVTDTLFNDPEREGAVVSYGASSCGCCEGVYGWSFDGCADILSVWNGDRVEVIGNIYDKENTAE